MGEEAWPALYASNDAYHGQTCGAVFEGCAACLEVLCCGIAGCVSWHAVDTW